MSRKKPCHLWQSYAKNVWFAVEELTQQVLDWKPTGYTFLNSVMNFNFIIIMQYSTVSNAWSLKIAP